MGVCGLEKDIEYRRTVMEGYKNEIEPLFWYIPWLESRYGKKVSNSFTCDNFSERTMTFPVYEGTLLRFVSDVQQTSLMDRNYRYLYTRYRIHTPEEERHLIENVTIADMEILTGILSRYILEGRTKGMVWPAGVEEGIYLATLRKFQELFRKWCQPLNQSNQQE